MATGETIQANLGEGSLSGGDSMELEGQTLFVEREGQITLLKLTADLASGKVGASISEPSFALPRTIEGFYGCLLVVNSRIDAPQGQPELTFTVSSVPVPELSPGAATATLVSQRC